MDRWEEPTGEIVGIFGMFFDGEPARCLRIDTSRGDSDFRETFIVETVSGGRRVIKLADNDFTFPDRIRVWQRTAEEYRKLGYYCPEIYCDKRGGFPYVERGRHKCAVYAEEYSRFSPIEDRGPDGGQDGSLYDRCREGIWAMTARAAAKHFDYTEYPSAFCLFETFCPSDSTDEVLENALEWKSYADGLPGEFREQTERIWRLWTENRAALEPGYKRLPTSVFQADLNSTNILVDENGSFVGVCDFNLCGKDVFLNYLMRENFDGFEAEIELICEALRISGRYYRFSELEKELALPLYRCLKPLWYNKLQELKALGDDREAIKRFLDKTEYYLTADIDFKTHMEQTDGAAT